MEKKSKSKKKVKVADLTAYHANPKGGTDCEGYAYLSSQLLGDGSVRTVSPATQLSDVKDGTSNTLLKK